MQSFLKRRRARPAGPRKNQRKEPRAGQATSQRAEARRARVMGAWIRAVKMVGILAGAVLLGWALVTGVKLSGPALKRLLEIHTVTVEGLHQIKRQEVIDLVKLRPGSGLHDVVTSAIKERVESHPWVKEAVVTRVPLHELRISIVERKPAAIVRAGAENLLSDEGGHVLARLGQADDEALPVVTGIDSRALLEGDAAARQAVRSGIELAKLVGHTYEGRLQVNAANPSNLVASVRGVKFQFGDDALGDQWQRFQKVKPMLKTLDFDGRGRGANEVDLRFENRVIVRERG
jgi:cell division protein FtsQ